MQFISLFTEQTEEEWFEFSERIQEKIYSIYSATNGANTFHMGVGGDQQLTEIFLIHQDLLN